MKNSTKKTVKEETKNVTNATEVETLKEKNTTNKEVIPMKPTTDLPAHLKVPMQTILFRITGRQVNDKGQEETGTAEIFVNHTHIGKAMILTLNNFVTNYPNISILKCELVNNIPVEECTENGVVGGPDQSPIADGTQVSMNFWGFSTAIFQQMESKFEAFLKTDVAQNPEKSEALLPNDVGSLIADGVLKVRILNTPDRWFGVTYQEDKPGVLAQFEKFQTDGTYPEKLWS